MKTSLLLRVRLPAQPQLFWDMKDRACIVTVPLISLVTSLLWKAGCKFHSSVPSSLILRNYEKHAIYTLHNLHKIIISLVWNSQTLQLQKFRLMNKIWIYSCTKAVTLLFRHKTLCILSLLLKHQFPQCCRTVLSTIFLSRTKPTEAVTTRILITLRRVTALRAHLLSVTTQLQNQIQLLTLGAFTSVLKQHKAWTNDASRWGTRQLCLS